MVYDCLYTRPLAALGKTAGKHHTASNLLFSASLLLGSLGVVLAVALRRGNMPLPTPLQHYRFRIFQGCLGIGLGGLGASVSMVFLLNTKPAFNAYDQCSLDTMGPLNYVLVGTQFFYSCSIDNDGSFFSVPTRLFRRCTVLSANHPWVLYAGEGGSSLAALLFLAGAGLLCLAPYLPFKMEFLGRWQPYRLPLAMASALLGLSLIGGTLCCTACDHTAIATWSTKKHIYEPLPSPRHPRLGKWVASYLGMCCPLFALPKQHR